MPPMRPWLVAFALGCAWLGQGPGYNQNSHYALVRALADGTAVIDLYVDETGDWVLENGHYYSVKAPGLATASLPPLLVLDTLRAREWLAERDREGLAVARGELKGMIWALGLWGALLPALALAFLVRRFADDLDPGTGDPTAALLLMGTLVLPFATLYFAHVLAALLGFAAFFLLWRRQWPFAAGVLAGLAFAIEYPLLLVAVVLAVYALVRREWTFIPGLLLGSLPVPLYLWWAFGSPFYFAYEDAPLHSPAGFFGFSLPSPAGLWEILVWPRGLLLFSPVLVIAALGVARLPRAEAAVVGTVVGGFVLWNAGFFEPYGGASPGPRYLVPVLPFLALGLSRALRAFPRLTLGLGAISIAAMTLVTANQPLNARDSELHVTDTIGSYVLGLPEPLAIVPFVALIAAAATVALGPAARVAFRRRAAH
jgi:hypothetical protein